MKRKSIITVAICTYNRERYLPQLFNSIQTQTIDFSLIEVLLVNNNSPGNTEELGAIFAQNNPNIAYRYFLETKQGLSHARNRCIEEAQGKYITFLDDDAFIQSDYLSLLWEKFEQNESVSAIGGKILLHFESIVPAWESKYLNPLMGYYDKGNESFTYDGSNNNYPRGSNMSFRTAIFEEIGLFNPQLGRIGGNLLAGEEKDIFNRIFKLKKHQVVYFPELVVFHSVPVERTTRDFIQKQALQTGVSERFRTKNEGQWSYLKRIGIECWKWGASFLLWGFFALQGKFSKGNMLVLFRYWVSKGLTTNN
jgi:glucosyl-dolichyl phosphate glucuronosyltransferase